MKIILGLQNFGIWLKKDRYHLTNNALAMHVIKKGYAKEIMEITQDDFAFMFADFKLNGMPVELVKYFQMTRNRK